MGLLAAANSWNMGFKASLKQPSLVKLATRMRAWSDKKSIPLRTLATNFGVSHQAVSTVTIGCRTPEEVRQVCSDVRTSLPDGILDEFEKEFGHEVASFPRAEHWYYDKTSSKIN